MPCNAMQCNAMPCHSIYSNEDHSIFSSSQLVSAKLFYALALISGKDFSIDLPID
jgi:hypothetical protein